MSMRWKRTSACAARCLCVVVLLVCLSVRASDSKLSALNVVNLVRTEIADAPVTEEDEYFSVDGQHLRIRNMTLKSMIAAAYMSPRGVIGGPPWFGTRRFNIDIVSDFHPTCSRVKELAAYGPVIRKVLEMRFNLFLRELGNQARCE